MTTEPLRYDHDPRQLAQDAVALLAAAFVENGLATDGEAARDLLDAMAADAIENGWNPQAKGATA